MSGSGFGECEDAGHQDGLQASTAEGEAVYHLDGEGTSCMDEYGRRVLLPDDSTIIVPSCATDDGDSLGEMLPVCTSSDRAIRQQIMIELDDARQIMLSQCNTTGLVKVWDDPIEPRINMLHDPHPVQHRLGREQTKVPFVDVFDKVCGQHMRAEGIRELLRGCVAGPSQDRTSSRTYIDQTATSAIRVKVERELWRRAGNDHLIKLMNKIPWGMYEGIHRISTPGYLFFEDEITIPLEHRQVNGTSLWFVTDYNPYVYLKQMIVVRPGDLILVKPGIDVQVYSVEPTIGCARNFIDEAWLDSLHEEPIAGLLTCFAALNARQVQIVQDLAQAQRFSARLEQIDNALDWDDSVETYCYKATLDFLEGDFDKINDDLRAKASRAEAAELLDSQPESEENRQSPLP